MYAIKVDSADPSAGSLEFKDQKTMYGGKQISKGDQVFIFCRENEDLTALVARGVIAWVRATPKKPNIDRQTPRVSIQVEQCTSQLRPLSKNAIRRFSTWADGDPVTEINFKLYRQSTNKIVGLSDKAVHFLNSFF